MKNILKNSSFKLNNLLNSFSISNNINKQFYHSKYLILGGGTGGISVANQLLEEKVVNNPKDITIVDRSDSHFYQPGYTKIGGGVYDYKTSGSLVKYDLNKLTERFNFKNDKANEIIASQNKVVLDNEDITYDNLVISTGLQVDVNGIPGLEDLLENSKSNVCSIYTYDYAIKTAQLRERFQGGVALFTQPPAPIKCAGAPQKIMYLSDAYWKNKGITADVHFYLALGQIFGVKYYSDELEKIADSKGLIRHYKHKLIGFKDSETAIFENMDTKETSEHKFSFCHVTPPMKAPDVIKNSKEIIDDTGFVDIDSSMRHNKYENVWAIGDSTTLPNSKTAAAIFSQAPVLVSNMKSNSRTYKYGGYTACPLFLGNKDLMLAEFSQYKLDNGEVKTDITETFFKDNQNSRSKFGYIMTYSLGYLYNLTHYGKWFGKYTIVNPITKKNLPTLIAIAVIAGILNYFILLEMIKLYKLIKA